MEYNTPDREPAHHHCFNNTQNNSTETVGCETLAIEPLSDTQSAQCGSQNSSVLWVQRIYTGSIQLWTFGLHWIETQKDQNTDQNIWIFRILEESKTEDLEHGFNQLLYLCLYQSAGPLLEMLMYCDEIWVRHSYSLQILWSLPNPVVHHGHNLYLSVCTSHRFIHSQFNLHIFNMSPFWMFSVYLYCVYNVGVYDVCVYILCVCICVMYSPVRWRTSPPARPGRALEVEPVQL